MSRSKWIAVVITILAVVWMASGQVGQSSKKSETEKTAQAKAGVSSEDELKTVEVERLVQIPHVERLNISGRTQANRIAQISAAIRGVVETVPAQNGAFLKAGDVIATLRVSDRSANLETARNLVKQRDLEYKTARRLSADGFATDVQVATRRAELESAKADLKRAQIDLFYTKVKAPFDGVLEDRTIEVDHYLNEGEQIAQVIELNPMKVVSFISEQRISDVVLGQSGDVRLPNGETYMGQINFISRMADPTTRTFKIELYIDNPEFKIADGLTADISLDLKEIPAHKISPAILSLNTDGDIGVKYMMDDRVAFKRVNVKDSSADAIWVTGLPQTVDVITTGQDFVSVGQRVKVVLKGDAP